MRNLKFLLFSTLIVFALSVQFLETVVPLDEQAGDLPMPSDFNEGEPIESEQSEMLYGSAAQALKIVAEAQKWIGGKYVWGGKTPADGGFDCSGLAHYCHSQAGITIPHGAAIQGGSGVKVSFDSLKAGDLVFINWDSGASGSIQHVGIYIGNGNMIHAANENSGIKQSNISGSYWKGVFHSARRYW